LCVASEVTNDSLAEGPPTHFGNPLFDNYIKPFKQHPK
jgi:hypothetical protein